MKRFSITTPREQANCLFEKDFILITIWFMRKIAKI
jgi:hypothetical protein